MPVKSHGASNKKSEHHNLWQRWCGIKRRCYNENDRNHKNYGGRGIRVCDEWKDSFENFRDWALESGYNKNLSIDRVNVDGDYEPGNCRWVNNKVQSNNRTNNVQVKMNGETKNITQWCEVLRFDKHLARDRYQRGIRGEELFSPLKSKLYSDREIEFLKNNWNKMTYEEMALELNRSIESVKRKGFYLKLKRLPRRFRKIKDGKIIAEGTTKELAKQLNTSVDTIHTMFSTGRLIEISRTPEKTEEEVNHVYPSGR